MSDKAVWVEIEDDLSKASIYLLQHNKVIDIAYFAPQRGIGLLESLAFYVKELIENLPVTPDKIQTKGYGISKVFRKELADEGIQISELTGGYFAYSGRYWFVPKAEAMA